jgi:hypothetical protein
LYAAARKLVVLMMMMMMTKMRMGSVFAVRVLSASVSNASREALEK